MSELAPIDRERPTMNRQEKRSALSDQRMFDSAIELINERGTAKTTLKDIGEFAGYSRGLASYRFGSKDALWMELFKKFDQIWKEHIGIYVEGKNGFLKHCELPLMPSAIFSKKNRTI